MGFELRGNILRIKPRVPKHWRDFEITYRRAATEYQILVTGAQGGSQQPKVLVDGEEVANGEIPVRDDGKKHTVQVYL